MRRIVLSALLLSACISGEKGASSPEAPAPAGPDAHESAAPSAAGAATPASTGPKKVVGYFTNWSKYRKGFPFTIADVKPELLTHLNFAFAKVDPGPGGKAKPKFGIAAYDPTDVGPNGQYAQINALKKKAPHLKTFLSIGGWSHNDPETAWLFTTMAETAAPTSSRPPSSTCGTTPSTASTSTGSIRRIRRAAGAAWTPTTTRRSAALMPAACNAASSSGKSKARPWTKPRNTSGLNSAYPRKLPLRSRTVPKRAMTFSPA